MSLIRLRPERLRPGAATRVPAIAAALLLAAGTARAQVGEPGPLLAFRDSLAGLTDSGAVHRLADRLADQPSAPAQLRAGLAALRVAELGDHWRLADARAAFHRAERQNPVSPWVAYGLGMAKLAEAEWQISDPLTLGPRAGMGALEDGIAALRRSAQADRSFTPALEALAGVPDLVRDTALSRLVLETLRQAEPSARTPVVLLALGRLEREFGSASDAVADFLAYLAAGGDPGVGWFEVARTRFLLGYPGAAEAYYRGAGFDQPHGVAAYRHDLRYLVFDSALVGFDQAAGPARVAWLRRFWSERAARDLRSPDERLALHFRRYFVARRRFAPQQTRRIYWAAGLTDAYRSDIAEFDDRGVIYLRQGEPDVRVHGVDAHDVNNESWRYHRPDGDLIFHFLAQHGIEDYRLAGGLGALAAKLGRRVPDVALSRAELDPIYSRIAGWGPNGSGGELRTEGRIAAASLVYGTTHDDAPLRFPRALPVMLTHAVVGTERGQPLLHLVFGIAGDSARGIATPDGWHYPVRIRAALLDSADRVVASLDSSLTLVTPSPAGAAGFLLARTALPVPAGRWRIRIAVQQGDSAGVLLPTEPITVPDLADAGPVLSDLVLGWRRVGLTWPRPPADTVYFSPFGAYYDDAEVELYYEVYGVAPGRRYRTEIVIRNRRGGGLFRSAPRAIRLATDERALEPVIHGRRTLQLSAVEPGDYWLDVTVTDQRGHRTTRRTGFSVHRRTDR